MKNRLFESGGLRRAASVVMATCMVFALAAPRAIAAADPFLPAHQLLGKTHDSGFPERDDTYNVMGVGSDGKIYYVLCTAKHDTGGEMFSFDPKNGKIARVGDLTEACGEKGKKTVAQGKSHVTFAEMGGKLYFSTHAGYYSLIDGAEKMGVPPEGWQPYPGGHLLSYDLATGRFEDLGIPVPGEGVLAMSMDTRRGRIFGISWPKGHFFRYNLEDKNLKDFGLFAEQGEDGVGPTYRTLCRSIAVNLNSGAAYFTVSSGDIYRYDPERDEVGKVAGDNLRKDYFGVYDPASPGHMGYNWRQTFWRPADGMIYGVHGNSGYLFRFDPVTERVEVLERITSLPSKASGMFDQFSYGYLGFTLGPDGDTIHYLTGGPIYQDGRRLAGKESTAMGEAKGLENLHLITYHIPTQAYCDHGAIFYENGERPLYVNAIAVAPDGTVCTLARIGQGEHVRSDLVTIKP